MHILLYLMFILHASVGFIEKERYFRQNFAYLEDYKLIFPI